MAISETRKRFNEAFREARNAGDKTFEFEGRRYTTKLSEEKSPRKEKTVTDTGDEVTRISKRAPAPTDMAALIPRDEPRTPVRGESASGSELGRNVANTLAAMGPGKLAGLGAVGMEMGGAKRAQEAYNAQAAARRAEEGLNAREAAEAMQALRENKTMNPMAWMAGPKGMEAFKRGGAVKKKSSAPKVAKASRRGDGIAQRGKTRGRMI